MDKVVCESSLCAGCMACEDICPRNAIIVKDNIQSFSAVINLEKCINCKLCEKVCPSKNNINHLYPISWKQGWTSNDELRKKASSGGVASAIAQAFIANGGFVCSCEFQNGKFIFSLSENLKDVDNYSGSKYVKSNPIGMYKKIKEVLKSGKKVLLIALPCQVAATKLYIQDANLSENLYTIDLICHGTPSVKVLECFLNQHNQSLLNLKKIKFREKSNFKLSKNDMSFTKTNIMDSYTIGFLNSLFYTENCYHCKFATIQRISDVTLGDSWGSELNDDEKRKGISLVLSMTEKGEELIHATNLYLEPVDLERAIQSNAQLHHHSEIPKNYYSIMDKIKKGNSISQIVFFATPRKVIKQKIKSFLYLVLFEYKLKKHSGGGGIIHD